MSQPTPNITTFDLARAGDEDYAALNSHFNRYFAESRPDDPPEPVERTAGMLRNLPLTHEVTAWVARDVGGDEIRAGAVVRIDHDGANTHVAQFDIRVEPAYRCRGIGRELLRRIVAVAQRENRTLLVTYATDRIPASARFLERLGAERGRWDAHQPTHASRYRPRSSPITARRVPVKEPRLHARRLGWSLP